MARTPAARGLLAGFVLLLVGSVTPSFGQVTSPGQMLDPKLAPKMEDVVMTIPTADELKSCTVELVRGSAPGSSGWVLLDGNKKPLRRFFDSNGDNKVDIWSYFKDGVEVYREFDSTYRTGRPNNFRWLNSGGTKWGVGSVDPSTGKATIESWRLISAEEAGQEAFQALARQDFARLKLLFITQEEMQAIKLSARNAKDFISLQQAAANKFQDVTKRVNFVGTRFGAVESAVPQCVLDEGSAGENIIIKYASRPIQFESANKKIAWLHTGEIIQVGNSWRLVDVPSDTDPIAGQQPAGKDREVNPVLDKLLEEITELDKTPPPPAPVLAKDPRTEGYLLKRIELVQKIVPLDKADQREMWYKQLFDNLTAMAQNSGDEVTLNRLKKLKDDVVGMMPGTNLAAYGTYREMWTRYAVEMGREKDSKAIAKIQDKWLDQLADFVKTYSKADDTPEALYQIGNGSEFSGKDEEAKRWYKTLADSFPGHALTPRARGSVARLELPGKELTLSAPLLDNPGKMFDVAQLKGKIVIVHYWASDSQNYADDFVRLKRVMDEFGQKYNVELVCVNLDDDAAKAREALRKSQAPATHLYQAPSNNSGGGLNSPLAVQYGIQMLPTTFMIGRDGKVTNRALQISDILTELKKVQ